MIDTYYSLGGESQMTSVYERNMYVYCHIYKALTIIASQDCNLTHFVYLERVDKLCIHSDRH